MVSIGGKGGGGAIQRGRNMPSIFRGCLSCTVLQARDQKYSSRYALVVVKRVGQESRPLTQDAYKRKRVFCGTSVVLNMGEALVETDAGE